MGRGVFARVKKLRISWLIFAIAIGLLTINCVGAILARNLTYIFLSRFLLGDGNEQSAIQARITHWLPRIETKNAQQQAEALVLLGQGNYQHVTQILAQENFASSSRVKFVLPGWGQYLHSQADITQAIRILGRERGVSLLTPLAELYQHQRNYIQARLIWENIVKLTPDNFEAHHNLAQVLSVGFEDYTGAIVHYQEVIRLKPVATAEDYYLLGHSLYWAGRYEEALSILNRARGLSPTDALILIDITQTQMILSNLSPQEILTLAQEALRLDPGNVYTYSLISSIYLSLLHDPVQAEAVAQKALELQPTNTWAMLLMAEIKQAQAHPEEALGYLERFLELRPNVVGIWDLRADILLQLGQTSAACQSYLRALQVEPDDLEANQKIDTLCPQP